MAIALKQDKDNKRPAAHPKPQGKRDPRKRSGIKRMIRYRLHIPMIRSPHPPEHTARGVMMGMIWAMVPIFGLQMAAVLVTWVTARKIFNWDFSLVNGLAWTWTTNIITIIPTYYVFYVTGQIMLGNFNDITGYASFYQLFNTSIQPGETFFITLWLWLKTLVIGWGLPILAGSVPWTILSGWLGYRLSLKFVRAYYERRAQRMRERAQEQAQTAPAVDGS